jgi:hypothetical protein
MSAGAQKRPKQPVWVKKLRSDIKADNGAGFLVKLPSGRSQVQLTVIFDDGTRQQNYLPQNLSWSAEDALAIREWVRDIRKILHDDQGKSLKQAILERQGWSGDKQQDGEGAFSNQGWDKAAEKFLDSLRAINRPNSMQLIEQRVDKALNTLKTAPKPRNFEAFIRAYAEQHFHKKKNDGSFVTPPGNSGRKRGIEDATRFIKFAVEECGLSKRYAPQLSAALKTQLIGTRATNTVVGDKTIPLKPNQFSDFLDWLEKNGKHQLRLAVGLVGYFGLRECELALLMPVETPNGLRLKVGMQAKNNAKTAASGARKPRLAMHAVCEGRPANEALDMLAQYHSELVRLPKRLRKQIDLVSEKGFFRDVGDAFSEQVKATDFWKDLVKAEPGLKPNSLRHSFAWRVHKCTEMTVPTRAVAASMGHTHQTHMRYYGEWIDHKSVEELFDQFNQAVATA